MGTVIFIGRFQPFHKGHLHAYKELKKRFDRVVLVLGSSNKENTDLNPFSFEERKDMVQKVLGNGVELVPIPDVYDDVKWVEIIADKVKGFDMAVSGNDWTKKCFRTKGFKVEDPDFLELEKYNSTRIRELIREGKEWEDLVPKEVLAWLTPEKVERIKTSTSS